MFVSNIFYLTKKIYNNNDIASYYKKSIGSNQSIETKYLVTPGTV